MAATRPGQPIARIGTAEARLNRGRADARLHSACPVPLRLNLWPKFGADRERVDGATFSLRESVNHEQRVETPADQGGPMPSTKSVRKPARRKAAPAKKAGPARKTAPAKKKAGPAKKVGLARKAGIARKAGPAKKKARRTRKAA